MLKIFHSFAYFSSLFIDQRITSHHIRSFSLLRNKKINWKQSSGRSQENEMLWKTNFYTICPSLRSCGPQFLSYLPKRFTHLWRALYGDSILVHSFGAPIWPPEINKNIWSSLFLWKLFLFTRELAYVRIHTSSNTWSGYTAENQEERLFSTRLSTPILWKFGSSNCCIFEMKHAMEIETCTKIYFLLSST